MNGFTQFFQVTAPNVPTVEYTRSVGSQEKWITGESKGIIAPGCSTLLFVKGAFTLCGEMSSSLYLQFDTLPVMGLFYPFFVFNFPIKIPCEQNLWLINKSDSVVSHKCFWAKEP